MPVGSLPSSTGGIGSGDPAYWLVLHSPGVAPQLEAKLQGTLLALTMWSCRWAEVMTAVSPGFVSSTH